RRRAEPLIPIQPFGHRLGLLWAFDALRPERTTRPVHDLAHRPNGAVPNPFAEQAGGFGGLVCDCDLSGHAGFLRDLGDASRLVDGVRQRLLAENMFALLHRHSGDGRVQVVGGAHDNRVQIFLLLKEFAEITVPRTAVILARPLLRTVIAVDNFLARLTPGNAAGHGESVAQLDRLVGTEPIPATVDAEQLTDGFAEFLRVPLGIVRAGFVAVADSNPLNVGLAQKVKHHAQSLGADADESDIDL